MPDTQILEGSGTVLVVVDAQEAFRSAIGDFALVVSNISRAVRCFTILEIPILVTEQYPTGLGKTVEEVMLAMPEDAEILEKTTFSAFGAEAFAETLTKLAASNVLLCGLETHVCVSQTAHDLLDRGFGVHLLTDCVASRFAVDRNAGIEKMRSGGVVFTSIETALFEIMKDSRHDKFKEIQSLIK